VKEIGTELFNKS
jgi:hypothetical protein